jgi:PleD family two-component response regulator
MVQPLALVVYQKLLPGIQLVNRLQDLNYRVTTLSSPERLVTCAEEHKPIVVLADLGVSTPEILRAIRQLKANATTAHLPVVAVGGGDIAEQEALSAGVSLVVGEAAILNHLEECLERAMQVD